MIKRLLDIFSLRMCRNGYLRTSDQKSDLPFTPSTSISYKTGIFPLSDDVCYTYIWCFCAQFSCDLVTLTFNLLTLAVSDKLSFVHPTHIPIFSILWLSVPEICVTQSDHITISWNSHCACAVSRDLSPGTKNYPHFWNPWPKFAYSLLSLSGHYDED